MGILLTHGYFLHEDEKELQIMKPYPPLGILYLSAYLKSQGVTPLLFDTTFSSKEKFIQYLHTNKPQVIAFYTNLMTKINVLELVNYIKSSEELSHIKIILGGPDVTYNLDNYLANGADYIIYGEGEESIYELYLAIQNQTDLHTIDGIAYMQNGQLVKNKARTKIKDINLLPFPDREAIDLNLYLEVWKKHHGASSVTVSTQRGCPYTCKWCSTAVYGQSYRRRSAKLVADELEWINQFYKPDNIWFVDDVFTVSHKWLKEFHAEITSRNIKIQFECITRAERLNDEIFQLLKETGCFRIWIGAESGSQKIIDKMDRRVDVNTVRSMINRAKDFAIQTGTFIMVGYPDEDIKDIKETVNHLKISNPDLFTITVAYPIKGTDLYQEIESSITKLPDWNTSTDREIDFKRKYTRSFYDDAVRYIVNEVNAHKNKGSLISLKYKLKSLYAQTKMTLKK